jgi:hypothetical protein
MSSVTGTGSDGRATAGSRSKLHEALARAARCNAGLSVLLAGSLAVLVYFVGASTALSPAARGLLSLTPFLWVALKGRLARFGGAGFRPSALERRAIAVSAMVATLCCLLVLGFALWVLWGKSAPWQVWASLAFTVALPIIVWRFLHWVDELILGTFLMYQAVTMLAGQPYAIGERLHIPIVGLVAMLAGAKQYHDWRRLDAEVRS